MELDLGGIKQGYGAAMEPQKEHLAGDGSKNNSE